VLNYIADIRISMTDSFISRSFVEEILKITIGEKTRVKLECEVLGIKKNISFKLSDK
jgi:hypothetical protein